MIKNWAKNNKMEQSAFARAIDCSTTPNGVHKYYSTVYLCLARKKSNGGIIMQKKNESLAMEILRTEKRHTHFWFTAFVVAVFVTAVSHMVGKWGA